MRKQAVDLALATCLRAVLLVAETMLKATTRCPCEIVTTIFERNSYAEF